MASSPRTTASPVAQAEQARQVVAVLGRIEDRMVTDPRCGSRGGTEALPGVIDESSRCEVGDEPDAAEIAEVVVSELTRDLPLALRFLGSGRPRWALSLYTQPGGEQLRTLELVRATHRRLGGAPRHPSAHGRRTPPRPLSPDR